MVVPMNVQYPLFLKILTFDRELAVRAGAEVVIGVVYQERVRESWLAKDELLRVVESSPVKRVKDLSVRAVAISLDDPADLEEALVRHGVDVIYVSPLRAFDIEQITRLARGRNLLTLTGVPDYVDAGIAIGIGLSGDLPEILVNLRAAKAEGADLHASLLRLATLTKE
jgi:hypothetical protein